MLSVARVEKIIYLISILLSKMINRSKNPATLNPKRILVIRLDEIGDLCYTLPALQLLRNRYPEAKITLWCRPFAGSLVRCHPAIDVIVHHVSELKNRFDLVVDMRGKWAGIAYAITHRTFFRLERGSVRLRNRLRGKHPHETETNIEIIAPVLGTNPTAPLPQIFPSPADEEAGQRFIDGDIQGPFVVMHTLARRELRMWGADNFETIANWLHREKNLEIVFCGDKNDNEYIGKMMSRLDFRTFSIAGNHSLGAFAAIVSKASLFIGNESGPLHIASVSGTPSLGLYGPGEPFIFYPKGRKTAWIHHVLPCNPCDQIHCKFSDNPCIRRITVEQVKAKCEELLAP